jgi:hypothetical protein
VLAGLGGTGAAEYGSLVARPRPPRLRGMVRSDGRGEMARVVGIAAREADCPDLDPIPQITDRRAIQSKEVANTARPCRGRTWALCGAQISTAGDGRTPHTEFVRSPASGHRRTSELVSKTGSVETADLALSEGLSPVRVDPNERACTAQRLFWEVARGGVEPPTFRFSEDYSHTR